MKAKKTRNRKNTSERTKKHRKASARTKSMEYSRNSMPKITEPKSETRPDLKEGGGLQNIAQLLSQGYTVAAYIMSSSTRASIDEWIDANPDRNPPFSAAPTEIDESIESISVRLKEPDTNISSDGILEKMKVLAPLMPKTDPAKPTTLVGDTNDQ